MNYRAKYILIGIIIGLNFGLIVHHFTKGCEHSVKTVTINSNYREFKDSHSDLYINNEHLYNVYVLDEDYNEIEYSSMVIEKTKGK